MRVTPFAGLTVLEPGEPFSTDGYSFQDRNPEVTDRLLRVGAVSHRHDEHLALEDPPIAPSGAAIPSGGAFPAATDVVLGYTLVDAWGGETLISDLAEVTTPAKIPEPDPPSVVADYTAGGLLAGTYSYVKTWIDGAGGETLGSIPVSVAVDPGHASGRAMLSGLSSGMALASAAGWRLYKSGNGSDFLFLASGTSNTLVDDGTLCGDCTDRLPGQNTTLDRNVVELTMPASAALAPGAVSFRLYASIGVGFGPSSFFGEYPRASGGAVFSFAAWNPGPGRPPVVSTAIPGAERINAETDILNLHWLAPVAASGDLASGAQGDVRLVLGEGTPYAVLGSATGGASGWSPVPSGGAGPGGTGQWLEAVADLASLPSSGNVDGDIRVTLDNRRAYSWLTDIWLPFPSSPGYALPLASTGWSWDAHVPDGANDPKVWRNSDGDVMIQGAFQRTASGAPSVGETIFKLPLPGGFSDVPSSREDWYSPNQSHFEMVVMYLRAQTSPYAATSHQVGIVEVNTFEFGGGGRLVNYISGAPAGGFVGIEFTGVSFPGFGK